MTNTPWCLGGGVDLYVTVVRCVFLRGQGGNDALVQLLAAESRGTLQRWERDTKESPYNLI